jgi:hypothetical protein
MRARLIFIPSETNNWTGNSFPRVFIEHWRAYKVDGSKLIVIDAECNMFIVSDLTESVFHSLVQKDKILHITYEFRQLVLVCDVCFGRGVLDWVSNATHHSLEPPSEPLVYKRDKRKLPKKSYNNYYISSPRQKVGEELCLSCQGTELHAFGSRYKSRILT